MITIPSAGTEYARVKVTVSTDGVTINTQPVALAFLTSATTEPVAGNWVTGTWLDDPGTTRHAGVLVGPAAHVLAEGSYWVWVKITDSPETVVRRAGRLTIT